MANSFATFVVKKRGGNVRNARTTHPRKEARRQRAAERFSVAYGGSEYLERKQVECEALGLQWSAFI